jgi:CheY-like chemotaxis protein
VLIVDDDQDGRSVIARILEGRGALTECAPNAQEALKVLSKDEFDVFLSDIGMPTVDGYELIRRVRRMESPSGRIPAIAVTAYARPEDRQRALLAGYQMHLCKPIETAELVAGIASLLSLSR